MTYDKELAERIGRTIMATRIAHGMTRYELAKRAGMSQTHLKDIEEGKRLLRVDVLNRLCKALQRSLIFPI